MTEKTRVLTADAPAPAHVFSQGVRKGPIVQVSGQGPVDPATGEYLFPGDVAAQTLRTLENVEAILKGAGATRNDIVRVGVFLKDGKDFAAMNEAYSQFFGDHKPARTTVEVKFASDEMRVEIDAVAYKP